MNTLKYLIQQYIYYVKLNVKAHNLNCRGQNHILG